MTDNITIPPEAREAVHDLFEPGYLESIGLYPEAIIRAALNAWPGMDIERFAPWSKDRTIHLPLPQEARDE